MGFVLEKSDTYSSILNYFQRNQMKCFVKWNLFYDIISPLFGKHDGMRIFLKIRFCHYLAIIDH